MGALPLKRITMLMCKTFGYMIVIEGLGPRYFRENTMENSKWESGFLLPPVPPLFC